MSWRTLYADKLVTAEEAAGEVESGDRLWTGMLNSVPMTFARTLHGRRAGGPSGNGLRDVEVQYHMSPFNWLSDGGGESFRPHTGFTTAMDRGAVNGGEAEYLPMGNFERGHWLRFLPRLNIGVVTMSPPDDNGYLSFGGGLWANKTMRQVCDRWFAEFDERLIRTAGDNYLHISEVDLLFDHDSSDDRELPIAPRDPEVEDAAAVICTLVAEELIADGDCLQIGLGDVSAALPVFLGNRKELGLQTELFGGGVIDKIEEGVITGSRKQMAQHKAVGSGFAQMSADELRRGHMHPQIELWDFCDTDDLRKLVQNDNYKAINNALQIDATGQVTAETLGTQTWSGPGGQTIFAMAGSYSAGGSSIIVLPSSSVVNGERVSRVVASLPPGVMVTVPRTFVDYVVTEQGVATLSGRTVRQRVEELVSVSHPDFREDLRKQAVATYGL